MLRIGIAFFLREVYLQIIAGNEKPPFNDLVEESANSSEGDGYRVLTHSRLDDARPGESAFRS